MKLLQLESLGDIGILRFHRPEVLNALSSSLLEEMSLLLEKITQEGNIKVLILSGSGDRAFSAGADIKEMKTMNRKELLAYCSLGQKVVNQLKIAPFVTIAAIQGFALGGGLEMALGCDFIYASQDATLGLPEVNLGLIPAFGGISHIIEAVGIRRAKELLLTGASLSAKEAYEYGLVNHLCAPKELIDHCRKIAEKITQNSSFAVAKLKKAIMEGSELSDEERLKLEANFCSECQENQDFSHRTSRFQ